MSRFIVSLRVSLTKQQVFLFSSYISDYNCDPTQWKVCGIKDSVYILVSLIKYLCLLNTLRFNLCAPTPHRHSLAFASPDKKTSEIVPFDWSDNTF